MKNRLQNLGLVIDRKKKISFSFDNKKFFGYEGDTLASALLANDIKLVARSFKYHRPRGIFTCGVEEPNALVSIGFGNNFEPNVKATTVKIYEGMISNSQNCWPSLFFDFGSILSKFSFLFPAGFYYKTFMFPSFAWKSIYEPIIRKISGLGNAPKKNDEEKYEFFYFNAELLIIGAGISGLKAAEKASQLGLKVLIIEQSDFLGGRTLVDENEIEGENTDYILDQSFKKLKKDKNIVFKFNTTVTGMYDHGFVLANEKIVHKEKIKKQLNCRLWKIRAKKIILATGAQERPLVFENNDLPGIMLLSSIRDYLKLFGVCCGRRVILFTNNDDAYKTALEMFNFNIKVDYIIDLRAKKDSKLIKNVVEIGTKIFFGYGIKKSFGKNRIEAIKIFDLEKNNFGKELILKCDLLGLSGGWSPILNLWSHTGGKIFWDKNNEMYVPFFQEPPINHLGQPNTIVIGSAAGNLTLKSCILDSSNKVKSFLSESYIKNYLTNNINNNQNSFSSYSKDYFFKNFKDNHGMTFIDMQNDVKVSDLNLAVLEGFENIEHVKRYTTMGMATDQGKLSNVNGSLFLSNVLNKNITNVGLPKFRPPYTPLNLGSIAGEATGKLFKPTRKTVIDSWHEANGAIFEQVGDWRRPLAYIKDGSSLELSVNEEIISSRNSLGVFDASTLGKIIVQGNDAGKFLDLIYTNQISSLKVGNCRYGLICNENGFIFDDGVIVRLEQDKFLCHTTSGGEEKVYSWMEEWLQTEFFDLEVNLLNVTEQFCQISLSGPNARELLKEMTSFDFKKIDFPFMTFVECQILGYDCRIFRISFTGDLSFEISLSNSNGLDVWEKIIEKGKKFNIKPFGTEALHVMRAEKGYIMIGEETDGTVTPHDLNLSWAISKKKKDFIGKRAMERVYLNSSNRKKLVGLKSINSDKHLPQGAVIFGKKNNKSKNRVVGFITSSYYSPTLKRNIAMGLLENDFKDSKKKIELKVEKNMSFEIQVVDYMVFDPKGEKLNG